MLLLVQGREQRVVTLWGILLKRTRLIAIQRNQTLIQVSHLMCFFSFFFFFYDDKAMGTHITLKLTGCSCPWVQFLSRSLGDKPVNQPALSQTLVGHSVIVVRHCIVRNLYSSSYKRSTCRRHCLPTCSTSDTRDRLKSNSVRETCCVEHIANREINSLFG